MVNERLQDAISAYKAGRKSTARQILSQLVIADPKNEIAWLWLSACVDDVEQKKHCLNKVLALNPTNQNARAALEQLEPKVEQPSSDEITANAQGIVMLSCPSCGGKLKITDDLQRFACVYCGKEHIVRRSGGVVSLAPIAEALREVQSNTERTVSELSNIRTEVNKTVSGLTSVQKGVDRASAELTITRLRNEIAALEIQKQRNMPSEKTNQSVGSGCLLSVGALAVGLYFKWDFAITFGVIGVVLIVLLLLLVYAVNAPIESQIAQKKRGINALLKSISS